MIDKSDLDDIFGIPQDGSHLDDDSGSADDVAFGNVVSQNVLSKSFNDQISSLHKDISSVVNNGSINTKDLDINNDKKNDGGNEDELQTKKNRKSTSKSHESVASINSESNNKVSSQSSESLGSSSDEREQIVDAQVDVSKKNETNKEIISVIINGWNTKTSNLTFISFYEIKRDSLNGWLLPGGEIDFIKTQNELISAKVDLSSIEFGDIKSMFDSLKNVQHWKDRVTEISLKVNAQYYSWKRAVDLFRGMLARTYYEKPAEKQEGVVMEHMGDMIRYFSQLEALHANVDAVVRNLDNAFDCISRQITISLPQQNRESESVEKRVNKNISSNISEGGSFADIMGSVDALPSNSKNNIGKASSNSFPKKIGTVDWTSI